MKQKYADGNQGNDMTDLYAFKFKALWSALKQEHISLWLLCVYFFFEYIRPQTLYPVMDVLPWAQLFIIMSMMAAIMDKSVNWVSNGVNRLFIIFCLIVIISGFFAFRPSESLKHVDIMGGWFVVYFLVITIVNTERRLLLFLLAYGLFNLKMAQHGAIGWAERGFSFASYGLIGSPGWFRNSGEYAIQMLIFGSLSAAIFVSLKNYWGRYKKWFFYLVVATGFMAIIGASSRGAQLGLAAIGIWFMLKQKNGFKGLLVIGVVAIVLYYSLPDAQLQRFHEMGNDDTSLQRLVYWKFALNNVIPKFPFLGVGYENWLPYLNFIQPGGMGPLHKNQVCHNIYIQAASELGYTGLFSFLMLIIFAFINNVKTRVMTKKRDNKLLYNLTYGLDAGLIGYLVAGSFVTVLYYPFFWVQIAMIVMLNNVAKKSAFKVKVKPSN